MEDEIKENQNSEPRKSIRFNGEVLEAEHRDGTIYIFKELTQAELGQCARIGTKKSRDRAGNIIEERDQDVIAQEMFNRSCTSHKIEDLSKLPASHALLIANAMAELHNPADFL